MQPARQLRQLTASEMAIVLIVEDEALIRWSLRLRLTELGLDVLEAESGSGALKHLAHDGISGVLLDLRLPDISGIEVLRQLRKTHPGCRVWVMTAYGTPEVRKAAAELGVVDFVDKPFDVQRLVSEVNSVLSNQNKTD